MGLRLTGGDACTPLGAVKATSGNSTAQAPQRALCSQTNGLERIACEKTAIESLVACVCAAGVIWAISWHGVLSASFWVLFSGKGGTAQRRHPDGAPPTTIWLGKNVHARERLLRSLVACVCNAGVILGLRLTGGDVCTPLGAVKATSGNSTAQAPQQAPVLKQIAWKECACEKRAIESLVACVCAAGVILGHRLTGGDVCTPLGAVKATSGNSTAQAPQQAPCSQANSLERMCV